METFHLQKAALEIFEIEVQRDYILDFGDFAAFNPERMAVGVKSDQVKIFLQRIHGYCKRAFESK